MKDMGRLVKEYLENTVMSTNQWDTKYSRNFLKDPIKTKMIKQLFYILMALWQKLQTL